MSIVIDVTQPCSFVMAEKSTAPARLTAANSGAPIGNDAVKLTSGTNWPE